MALLKLIKIMRFWYTDVRLRGREIKVVDATLGCLAFSLRLCSFVLCYLKQTVASCYTFLHGL